MSEPENCVGIPGRQTIEHVLDMLHPSIGIERLFAAFDLPDSLQVIDQLAGRSRERTIVGLDPFEDDECHPATVFGETTRLTQPPKRLQSSAALTGAVNRLLYRVDTESDH